MDLKITITMKEANYLKVNNFGLVWRARHTGNGKKNYYILNIQYTIISTWLYAVNVIAGFAAVIMETIIPNFKFTS